MWPFSKIKELEDRIKALEGGNISPKMPTTFGESYAIAMGAWLSGPVGDRYSVTHADAIRAILKHLDLALVKTTEKPAEVRVEKRPDPISLASLYLPPDPPKKRRK